ncbi:MAG: hypothetical protein ISR69_08670 [Gammaproteobacteria bacterium]|nr:hypothetical protein [Gammaproteobacteria bacterium]
MNKSVEQLNTQEHYEDEINLKDLFYNIWRTRVAWVIALIIVPIVFWGAWGLKAIALPNLKTFGLVTSLTFENVDKAQYPNKTSFKYSDIGASAVLMEVYEKNNIEQYGVRQEQFVQMINVSPYAPNIDAIELKYKKKLENSSKMTPQDIDLAQEQKNKELLIASRRGVIIELTEIKANQIPEHVISKLLQDIYKTWAEKAINERNVLKTDIGMMDRFLWNSPWWTN